MTLLTLFGLAVFGGLVNLGMKAYAYRWRLLAFSYRGRVRPAALASKRLCAFVMTGGGWGYSHYAGITIEVGSDGLWMQQLPPFSIWARPLFLPFDEMTVKPSHWYLNANTFALMMSRCSGVEILVDDQLLDWLRASSARI